MLERRDLSRYRARRTTTLNRFSAEDTAGLSEVQVAPHRDRDLERLGELQEVLYVARSAAVLIVLQGMDACGKDGTIRHVFSACDPLGCRAVAFGVPTEGEALHDYLWRVHVQCPARGEMVIFNRSHYEAVLVERVLGLVPARTWRARYDQINAFEEMLAVEGTLIFKFFLHISYEEQQRRLIERIRDPLKRWKVAQSDWDARARWDEYRAAYQELLQRTSTTHAPWYVIPADRKWFRNYLVGRIVAEHLEARRSAWQGATIARGERQMAELAPAIRALVDDP